MIVCFHVLHMPYIRVPAYVYLIYAYILMHILIHIQFIYNTSYRTALDRDLVFKVTETLRSLFTTRSGQRLTVGQLRQMLLHEASGGTGGGAGGGQNYDRSDPIMSISVGEVEAAVRELEAEGMAQYIERTQTVVVRAAQ